MNPADQNHGSLPRYGIRDDEKTRPYAVDFDWDATDEATVHVSPLEHGPAASAQPARADLEDIDDLEEVVDIEQLDDIEELDDIDVRAFGSRWHGVGRRPGAVALAVVLGASFVIGAFALFGPAERHAGAADTSALLQH
jgi:hypothetical protein